MEAQQEGEALGVGIGAPWNGLRASSENKYRLNIVSCQQTNHKVSRHPHHPEKREEGKKEEEERGRRRTKRMRNRQGYNHQPSTLNPQPSTLNPQPYYIASSAIIVHDVISYHVMIYHMLICISYYTMLYWPQGCLKIAPRCVPKMDPRKPKLALKLAHVTSKKGGGVNCRYCPQAFRTVPDTFPIHSPPQCPFATVPPCFSILYGVSQRKTVIWGWRFFFFFVFAFFENINY